MNQFEYQRKKPRIDLKKLAAAVLCICMLLASVDMAALAAGIQEAADALSEEFVDNVGYAFVTPDIITPDYDYEYGAAALSGKTYAREIGESVEMKVYAWGKTGNFQYSWYAPSGEKLKEVTGDTLNIENLQEKDFGYYRCEVRDGEQEDVAYFRIKNPDSGFRVRTVSNTYQGAYFGGCVTFEVEAADYGSEKQNLTYQWYEGSKLIPGATGAKYTFINERDTEDFSVSVSSKKYFCEVSNGTETVRKKFIFRNYGAGDSVEVKENNKIVALKRGSEATFHVEAASKYNLDLTYQWYKGSVYLTANGVDDTNAELIAGAVSADYTFTVPSDPAANAVYSCLVSDGYSVDVWRKGITLYNDEVEALTGSYDSSVILGSSLTLSPEIRMVDGIEESELVYQWYKISDDGNTQKTILSGETKKELALSKITEKDLGNYMLEISWGNGNKKEVQYTIEQKVFQIGQSAYYAYNGMPVTYMAAYGDSNKDLGGATYQWYQFFQSSGQYKAIQGATGRTLTVTYTDEMNDGVGYRCGIMLDGVEYITPDGYLLGEIQKDSTEWAMEPDNHHFIYHKKYDKSIVLYSGLSKGENANLTIKWEYLGSNYGDWKLLDCKEEVCELKLDEIEFYPYKGISNVRVTVTDEQGNVREKSFHVTPEETLKIEGADLLYETIDLHSGENCTLHCKASSTEGKVSYQWEKINYKNGDYVCTAIEGANSSDYTISGRDMKDGTYLYRCAVSDGNETQYRNYSVSWRSLSFKFIMYPNMFPGKKDVSVYVIPIFWGTDIHDQCQYQWKKRVYDEVQKKYVEIPIAESERISGVNTDTLTFKEILMEDIEAEYCCEVIDRGKSYETIDSKLFYLISMSWKGTSSRNLYFSANKNEAVLLQSALDVPEDSTTYQWYHNGAEISGATKADYPVQLKNDEDFGEYSCEAIVNGCKKDSWRINMNIHQRGAVEDTLKVLAKKHDKSSVGKILNIGDTIDMGAVAYTNRGSFTYQWQVCTASNHAANEYTFKDISGETSEDYSLKIRSKNDYGTYRCVVKCPETGMEKYVVYGLYSPDQKKDPSISQPENPTNPKDPVKPDEKPASIVVANVTLNQTNIKLAKGKQAVLKATVLPANAANKNVIWSSSNPKIVTVKNGVVTALEKGSAIITVTTADGKKTASCNVQVTIQADQIMLLKSMSLKKGDSYTLKASLFPADSADSVTWSSSNEKVVTVSADGKVQAVAAGKAKITAMSESGKKAVCEITVVKKKVSASKVKLNKTKLTMKSGGILQLQASMKPKNSTDSLKWTSSNSKAVKVDENGVITANQGGKAKITVKSKSGKKATCTVIVTEAAESVKLNKTSLTLKVKKTFQLKAKMTPKNATEKLKWKSSNKKVVSVDKKGKLKALKKGKSVITVTTSSGKKATCSVTVK